jgi:hypothetical protein
MKLLMALVLAAVQPTAAGQIGVDAVAGQTTKGVPATFDLAGFRLGMTEAEAEQVLKTRGMTVTRRSRTNTFEDRVRKLVNLRGGRLPMKGGSVLESADIDDGKGGKIMIRMFAWPDGARIRSVTYLPLGGTDPAAWRTLLVDKYGPPARDGDSIDADGLHANWCGRLECIIGGKAFSLGASVGLRGGSIALSQPEGTSSKLTALVEQEALKHGPQGTPAL